MNSTAVNTTTIDQPNTQEKELILSSQEAFFCSQTEVNAAKYSYYSIGQKWIFNRLNKKGQGEFYKLVNNSYYELIIHIRAIVNKQLEKGIYDYLHSHESEASGKERNELHKLAGSALKKAQTNFFLKNVISILAERITVINPPFNETPYILICLDGIIDFSSPQIIIRQARKGEFFKDPLPYTCTEIINAASPENYYQLLSDIFPDEETRNTAAYCLAGAISGIGKKSIVICCNALGNGAKNTFADIVTQAIGHSRSKFLDGSIVVKNGDSGAKRFETERLRGLLFAFFDEVTGSFDVSALKRLTSLSYIRGEAKGQDPINFLQTFVIFILTNALPSFYPADDSAFLNRLIVLIFETVFYESEEQKEQLIKRGANPKHLLPARDKKEILSSLESERAGILKQMIQDAIDLRETYKGKIPESAKCKTAKEAYRTENDILERFIEDSLIIEQFGTITNKRLHELYQAFSGDTRLTSQKLSGRICKKITTVKNGHRIGKERGLLGLREKGEQDELSF